MTVELLRVVICDKSFSDIRNFYDFPEWKNAKSYLMVEFKATNNSEKTADLMLFQNSSVATAGKQIDSGRFFWEIRPFGDNPDGDYLPGVTMQGGYYIPLDVPFDEIQKVYFDFAGVFVNGSGIINNMQLNIDISDWTFEPRPED